MWPPTIVSRSFGPSSQTSGAMTLVKELLIKCNAKIKITIVRCRRVDFVFHSHQRPHPEIACSCGNAMMYPAVAVAQRVVCTGAATIVKVPHALKHSRNPGLSFAPGYWRRLWNVILYHCSGIQVWQERGEAVLGVRVWRTHTIPHICAISDYTGAAVLSGSRMCRLKVPYYVKLMLQILNSP